MNTLATSRIEKESSALTAEEKLPVVMVYLASPAER